MATENLFNKRMLTLKEASDYACLGLNGTRKLCDEVGATKHYGKRVMFDRLAIDRYFNESEEQK